MELFELILGNANSGSTNGLVICNLLAHSLILKVSELSQSSQNKPARSWDTYNRILLYLRKNYFRIKTIEELASEVNVDPAYLSRVFRRFHNESPYKFLIRLKMGHAASLLLSSRRLVKDIAYELGFENPFHFSRTFKSVYGVSPENFI
jgi:AraC-like DNA-binding protein